MAPSKRLKALQQEKSDLVARMEALLNSADDEHRDLTADAEKDYQELEAQLPALDKRDQTYGNAQQRCAARQDDWIVNDHPYVAVTDADGKFRIENLPAGEHTFRVWHERAGFMNPVAYQRDLKVNVEADKVLTLPAFKVGASEFEK